MNTDLNERLLAVIRDATSVPTLAYARPPEPLTGGFWAELLAFSLVQPPQGWPRDLVARIMPEALVARKETIVQAAVSAAGFPTPAVRASGGQGSGLGRAYMVMDLASGTPLLPSLSGTAALTAGLRLASRLPETLASTMAGLHQLDPGPVRDQLRDLLFHAPAAPVTLSGLLDVLAGMAAEYQRADLTDATRWLIGHPPQPAPEVICHGDLHPFNLLANGTRVTVLDWSAALLAPRAYDVAFTSLMLSEPPLEVPDPLRRLVRWMGHQLARRFVRRYQVHARVAVGADELRWYQAVVCLRILVEVAGWVNREELGERAGHPWLVSGPAIAARLSAITGAAALPR
jgi:aminoglycoside phosphotransferase (APT) family kinase protein